MNIRGRFYKDEKNPTGPIGISKLAWVNLNICVGIAVLHFLFMSASRILRAEEISAEWGPFAGEALMAPFVMVFILALFWYIFYRARNQGARLFAFLTCLFIGILCLGVLLDADMMEKSVDWKEFLFFTYIGVSHLLFAIFGKEQDATKKNIFIRYEEKVVNPDDADWWKKPGNSRS